MEKQNRHSQRDASIDRILRSSLRSGQTASSACVGPEAIAAWTEGTLPAAEAAATAPRHVEEPEPPAEEPAAETAPDGGWQKPDWAIPDNEIPVNRGPDGEDRRIVIPAEPAPSAN